MLELPEIRRIAAQASEALGGKTIACATRGSNPHKWLFMNGTEDEFASMLEGKTVAAVTSDAKWLHLHCEPGAVLSFYEMGGQIRYAETAEELPGKWHFLLRFTDRSCLYAIVQGWGFVQVVPERELAGQSSYQPGPSIDGEGFTLKSFRQAVADYPEREKKAVKAFVTSGYAGAGLGNGYLHDVLFLAGIQPTRKVASLSAEEVDCLYESLAQVTREAIAAGGRDVERDLYGKPGGYRPILDKRMADQPCPQCATPIRKIAFLGGSCYFCPSCQR